MLDLAEAHYAHFVAGFSDGCVYTLIFSVIELLRQRLAWAIDTSLPHEQEAG